MFQVNGGQRPSFFTEIYSLYKEKTCVKKPYHCAFEVFDENNDQTINVSELRKVFDSLKVEVSEVELKEMIAEVDEDGSGSIEKDEFLALMAEKKAKNQIEETAVYEKIFKHFDINKNGLIDFCDLKKAMKMLEFELSDDEVKEMVNVADNEGNGKLSFEKFKSFMMGLE